MIAWCNHKAQLFRLQQEIAIFLQMNISFSLSLSLSFFFFHKMASWKITFFNGQRIVYTAYLVKCCFNRFILNCTQSLCHSIAMCIYIYIILSCFLLSDLIYPQTLGLLVYFFFANAFSLCFSFSIVSFYLVVGSHGTHLLLGWGWLLWIFPFHLCEKWINEWQTEYRGHKYICLSIRNGLTESFRSFPFSFSHRLPIAVFSSFLCSSLNIYTYFVYKFIALSLSGVFYSFSFPIFDILANNSIRLSISFDGCLFVLVFILVSLRLGQLIQFMCVLLLLVLFFSLVFFLLSLGKHFANLSLVFHLKVTLFVHLRTCSSLLMLVCTGSCWNCIFVISYIYNIYIYTWERLCESIFRPCLFSWIINLAHSLYSALSLVILE